MEKSAQIEFVKTLCDNVMEVVIAQIKNGNIPHNWDGFELRWYLAEKFNQQTYQHSRRRKREYNNTVLVNNL